MSNPTTPDQAALTDGDRLKYIAECIETHAEKFPVPSHMKYHAEFLRSLAAPTPTSQDRIAEARGLHGLAFELSVAATTFETVTAKEYREGIFNASHAKLLRKAIAALNALPVKDMQAEWRAMKDAPKDEPLLLWAKRAGDPTHRIVCGWRYSNQWAIYGCGKSQDCLDIIQPVAWQPLPLAASVGCGKD